MKYKVSVGGKVEPLTQEEIDMDEFLESEDGKYLKELYEILHLENFIKCMLIGKSTGEYIRQTLENAGVVEPGEELTDELIDDALRKLKKGEGIE